MPQQDTSTSLRDGLLDLIAEAERRPLSCPTARLVPARRLRQLLEATEVAS